MKTIEKINITIGIKHQAVPRTNKNPVWFSKKAINLRNIRNREYKKLQKLRIADTNADESKFITAKNEFEKCQTEL